MSENENLIKQKFDYIFFTGSQESGKEMNIHGIKILDIH